MIRVLAQPALKGVHERALGEISRAFVEVLYKTDEAGLAELLHATFAALRRSKLSRSPTALYLMERIGTEMLTSGNPQWVQLFVDELLDSDFPGPRFEGFADDWQVRVDPSHLRAIRTYVSLIASNPERARPLVAALVAHLQLGGIFVADTDLFQKDISRLLNAKIAPPTIPSSTCSSCSPPTSAIPGAKASCGIRRRSSTRSAGIAIRCAASCASCATSSATPS